MLCYLVVIKFIFCYTNTRMLLEFWTTYLYQPIFNVLIWIYNNFTDQNLGWAVVYLTILLRVVLLPFTLVTEKTVADNRAVEDDVERIKREFHQDPVQQKNEIRMALKKRRVRPFSRAIVIGVQLLVLILLYQVFIRGITGRNVIAILYPWVDFPGKINSSFYGFELGQTRTFFWPLLVSLVLFFEIYLGYRKFKGKFTQGHLAYIVIFPIFSFLALWILPMVKSLFILTSVLFSDIIHEISVALFVKKKPNNH